MSKITAQKANRVIQIPAEKVNEYKELGYTITEDGKVIHKPEADAKAVAGKLTKAEKEIATLKEQVATLTAQVGEKDAEIATLKEQVAEAQKATKDTGKK